MRKVNNYKDFINEEFFKRLFNRKKSVTPESKSRVDSCVSHILKFLSDNDVIDWNDFMKMTQFDKDVVNKLIDSEVKNMSELEDVRFKIRLELSDKPQLVEYQKELEDAEEYEKCAMIVKKLSK